MLEDKDILQVNATLITGILILLTLTKIGGVTDSVQQLAGWAVYAILPFAFSAVLILLSYSYSIANAIPLSALSTTIGFAFLSLILIWYFLVPLRDIFKKRKIRKSNQKR
jgi:hypothetical protein